MSQTETRAKGYADALNAVIAIPGAFDALDFAKVKLAQDGKEILAKSVGQRTEPESRRLNRLVVERGFPEALEQLHGQGWRPTLMTYGLGGLVMGVIFWLLARNWPREHPWCNAAEVQLIESGQSKKGEAGNPESIPWRQLLTSGNQWLFSLTNVFSNIGFIFLITLLPRFLDERFAVPVDQRGLMTTIPLFAASFGLIAGGWFTDRITRLHGLRWGRAIPMGLFKLPCVAALLASPYLPSPWAVTAALTLMAIFQDFGVPAVWAFAQDTGGKQVGAVLGWGNMWGNFGAGIAPPLMSLIAQHGGWDAVLYGGALAFGLCGIFGLAADASQPLFPSGPADEIDELA